ncbi:MAG: hypothetical protein Fur0018_20430 [Anaerolineales bacterium]
MRNWRRILPLLGFFLLLLGSACTRRTPVPLAAGETDTPAASPVPAWTATPTASPLPPSPTPVPTPTETPTPLPWQADHTRFAIIGDYGDGGDGEGRVAALVDSWNVDFIVTTGDNNYKTGSAETIDAHIGQFYHAYISPYNGAYGPGAAYNRFFPVPGNHDWGFGDLQPYLDYFTLPGNERYYDLIWGPVHFFMLDSDWNEPDGIWADSVQAAWLKERLAASTAAWKIVILHHPPYSSASHGNNETLQWPFAAWGADAVIGGHDHTYERIQRDGIVYFVNGIGGTWRYDFKPPVEGSQVRYNADYGVMLVEADAGQITFQFINTAGEVIDTFDLRR